MRRSLAAASLIVGVAVPVVQGTAQVGRAAAGVSGTVVDSTLGRGTLAGATVAVANTTLLAPTDTAGRFHFDGLGPGRYTLIATHPLLDSLGLDDLVATVTVGDDGSAPMVHIATPSLATFTAARCAGPFAEHEAILLGYATDVDGEPLPGAVVRAQWRERMAEAGVRGVQPTQREVRATADADGRFVLCGVPRDPSLRKLSATAVLIRGEVTLEATSADAGRGTPSMILLPQEQSVARHDLVLGDGVAAASVSGRVVDESGTPVVGARLTRAADTSEVAVTDSAGRFRVRLPARSEQLLVRALGRASSSVEFVAREEGLELGDIPLSRLVRSLDRVIVTGKGVSAERLAFDHRAATFKGIFLDDELMRNMKLDADGLALRVPGAIAYSPTGTRPRRFMMRRDGGRAASAHGLCRPRFWVDGVPILRMNLMEEDLYFTLAVRVEVYENEDMPTEYADLEGCGAVLIWTRP